MFDSNRIAFIGGDLRSEFMANHFISNQYTVYTYGLSTSTSNKFINFSSLEEIIQSCHILVFPTPICKKNNLLNMNANLKAPNIDSIIPLLTKEHIIFGGNFPDTITKYCKDKKIHFYDFLKDESIAILNSIATAEGAISKAIELSNINLHNSNCLILGYGSCGKTLASKLKALNAHVTVCARNEKQLVNSFTEGVTPLHLSLLSNNIYKYNFIFNTIPANILTSNILDNTDKNVVIIDIASYPGGVDFNYATSLNLKHELYLGIPGKISPKSSANILIDKIQQVLFSIKN